MIRYISKGDWFDKGTEAILLTDCFSEQKGIAGVFRGIKDGKEDEESCSFDEFEVIEDGADGGPR